MLFAPRKKSIAVILERLKPQSDVSSEVKDAKEEMLEQFTDFDLEDAQEAKDEYSKEDECLMAAEDILRAFHSNDAKALHEALQDYFAIADY